MFVKAPGAKPQQVSNCKTCYFQYEIDHFWTIWVCFGSILGLLWTDSGSILTQLPVAKIKTNAIGSILNKVRFILKHDGFCADNDGFCTETE